MSDLDRVFDEQEAHAASQPGEAPGDRKRAILGSLSLLAGIVILTLLAVDGAGELPFRMPRSWYTDRTAWLVSGFATIGFGWFLLKETTHANDEHATSGHPDRRPLGAATPALRNVVLYTRRGCHLCDEAREILLKYGRSLRIPREVDVDGDPELLRRFSTCVPVVEIDGKVRFRGRVNEILLRRLLAARGPTHASADLQSSG